MTQQCPEPQAVQTLDHAWVDITDYSTKPFWERRRCPVCGLEDIRLHDRSEPHTRNAWEVTTPCIEPVKNKIFYDELICELKRHGVREQPHCVGVPGNWTVGFNIGGSYPFPMLYAKGMETLENGFAKLLRWIRARQYNVNRYSDFEYQRRLADHSCACCDDD